MNNSVISDKCEGLELSIETELLLAIQRAERAESEKAMLLNKSKYKIYTLIINILIENYDSSISSFYKNTKLKYISI